MDDAASSPLISREGDVESRAPGPLHLNATNNNESANNGRGMWIAIIVLLVVGAPLLALWAYALGEVIRRTDLTGARKLAWLLALILVPVLGLAVYVVARPTRALYTEQPTTEFSAAEHIVRTAERRQRGELTDDEYLVEITTIATFT